MLELKLKEVREFHVKEDSCVDLRDILNTLSRDYDFTIFSFTEDQFSPIEVNIHEDFKKDLEDIIKEEKCELYPIEEYEEELEEGETIEDLMYQTWDKEEIIILEELIKIHDELISKGETFFIYS